ncbi:MAG: Flp pilus assembly protein CpaB [Sulfitobacter sp.]
MRIVFGLVLLVGIALAGGAVYMAKSYIGEYQSELARERASQKEIVPTQAVYVTERTLKYGEEIKKEDVREVQWPVNAIPEGTFGSIDDLFPDDGKEKRLVIRAMEKHEAVMAIKVTKPGQDAGLTSRLERGMRAFAIRVDVSSGVSGFLRPGDKVDVYWTGEVTAPGAKQSKDVTKLIEVGVQLIAVDQSASGQFGEATIARTVTVAVRPQQVAALAQAQSTGNLSLSLVGTGDDTIADATEVDQQSLLGLKAAEVAAEVQRERVCTIRTRRGAEVVEIAIPCTN